MSDTNSTMSGKKKQQQNMSMVLTKGTKVEVKCDEQGLRGAFYEATIVNQPSSSHSNSKAKVVYTSLLANNGVIPSSEHVCVKNIRPFPPSSVNVRPFEVNEVVDAYVDDGWWWKGVVTSVREVNEEMKIYKVLFENPSVDHEFCASKLRVHFDWIDNKWVKPPKQIGQSDVLVHNKERKTDVAVQLESANVLNNSCESMENYTVLNSKFKRTTRGAGRSKAESSFPCKKRRGETNATHSSSAECHENPAPLEQLIGEKTTSESTADNLPSVESMSSIRSDVNAAGEEATMEADTMSSVGGEENTAEYVASGHSPHDKQNQFDDKKDGETMAPTESPVTNVEVNNALDENEVMPFVKNPRLWGIIDSLEIFKLMPQKPHFRPLMNFGEAFREGFAIGYMTTFATVVEDISKLQITDSQNKFTGCLETLAELEKQGFSVKPAVNRVNKLLYIKDRQRQLADQFKGVDAQLAERSSKKSRLEINIRILGDVLRELRNDHRLFISLAEKNNRDIAEHQEDDSVIRGDISTTMHNFKSLAAASWK